MEGHNIVRQWRNTWDQIQSSDNVKPTSVGNGKAKSFISSSTIRDLTFGTGCSIYDKSIIPAIEAATSEIVIVTCFWAKSKTLESLNKALLALSKRCAESQRRITVRICFSSSSLFQKLFHTSSLEGRSYTPDEWVKKLGLPGIERLNGLDVVVKSIFVLPFSIMHPKFVIVDRRKVFLPSCNISWEDWFEGCIELRGPIVKQFVNFCENFWVSDNDRFFAVVSSKSQPGEWKSKTSLEPKPLSSTKLGLTNVPTIFLPSPHHRSPQFAILLGTCPPPPPTPLNTFLLAAFSNAKADIYLQTPNLTSPPVLSALLAALGRGVTVDIVTSERLMILEQLITAGTTTKRCVNKLIKRHGQLIKERWRSNPGEMESGTAIAPGALSVRYYVPAQQGEQNGSEPVQSHLKVTIIDGEITILGSGNMDRASWYTSQELGVAFVSRELAMQFQSQLDSVMQRRMR